MQPTTADIQPATSPADNPSATLTVSGLPIDPFWVGFAEEILLQAWSTSERELAWALESAALLLGMFMVATGVPDYQRVGGELTRLNLLDDFDRWGKVRPSHHRKEYGTGPTREARRAAERAAWRTAQG